MAKKIIIGVVVVLVLLIAAIVSIPFLFKDQINAKVKAGINEQLTAKLDYGDFDLSLFRSFPNFSFSLNDLTIINPGKLKPDTFAYVKNFNFTIDLKSVLSGGKYKILALNVTHPVIHATVDANGKSNWDILKPQPATPANGEPVQSSTFSLEIKQYKIANADIIYNDMKGKSLATISDLNFEGTGDVTSDIYDFASKLKIAALSYKSGLVSYASNMKIDADIKVKVDKKNNKYTLSDNTINLNNLSLALDGYVAQRGKATDIDLGIKARQTDFKNILSLVPAVFTKDFDKIKTSGSMAMNAKIKGVYQDENYPAINVDLKVNNGMFQYPSLPLAMTNIAIILDVVKPQGSLDATLIDIQKLHLEAGGDPIDATIKVKTPISNPDITANVNGKFDLQNLPKLYPVEGLKKIDGRLVMALNFNGRKKDIDAKNYSAIKASGNASLTNVVYESTSTPVPVRVSDMELAFTPQYVALKTFNGQIGKSDLNCNGKLDNLTAYIFSGGELTGNLNLNSNLFDANEWLQKDKNAKPAEQPKGTTASGASATTQYFKVPDKIDFTLNSQIKKVLYDNMVLENAKGQIVIRDEAINIDNLFANLLGGSATINAKYDTKGKKNPAVTFNYDIKNFDIQQTYKTVGMSAKMAPVMQYIQGNFGSDMKGSGALKQDMSVDYASLSGDGKINIPNARVSGLPFLDDVAKIAKIPSLQNIELKNAWTGIKFQNGRVNVDPFDLKLTNGYNMHVSGSNGFDQTIDYDLRLDVPSQQVSQATNAAKGLLGNLGLGNLGNVTDKVLPKTLQFYIKVKGAMNKPSVSLTRMGTGN